MDSRKSYHNIPVGDFELSCNKRIVTGKFCGPWNQLSVESYLKVVEELIHPLAGSPWVVLAVVKGEPMHTLESITILADMIKKQRLIGRCGTAVVFEGEIATARIYQLMLAKIYELSGEPVLFTQNTDEAYKWLERQLNLSFENSK